MKTWKVIGVMSGTSLDGLDLAYCEFRQGTKWEYEILHAETIAYNRKWRELLGDLKNSDGLSLVNTDKDFGEFIAEQINDFTRKHKLTAELIASHGHTVFHQPDRGLTTQIGNGSVIAAKTGIPVVYNFRVLDVALGGQGAPLVPAGDKLLFSEFDFCLNIGGIANVSFEQEQKRIAFDICPANMVLNHIAGMLGKSFDRNGKIAASGKLNNLLLAKLNEWKYYQDPYPKSLGREDVEIYIFPLLQGSDLKTEDMLNTFTEHIAMQIGKALSERSGKVLVTGGGAFNKYLVTRITRYSDMRFVVPDPLLVNYKEALVFAFLGVLKFLNKVNCYSSVTGASKDCSCGILVSP